MQEFRSVCVCMYVTCMNISTDGAHPPHTAHTPYTTKHNNTKHPITHTYKLTYTNTHTHIAIDHKHITDNVATYPTRTRGHSKPTTTAEHNHATISEPIIEPISQHTYMRPSISAGRKQANQPTNDTCQKCNQPSNHQTHQQRLQHVLA